MRFRRSRDGEVAENGGDGMVNRNAAFAEPGGEAIGALCAHREWAKRGAVEQGAEKIRAGGGEAAGGEQREAVVGCDLDEVTVDVRMADEAGVIFPDAFWFAGRAGGVHEPGAGVGRNFGDVGGREISGNIVGQFENF